MLYSRSTVGTIHIEHNARASPLDTLYKRTTGSIQTDRKPSSAAPPPPLEPPPYYQQSDRTNLPQHVAEGRRRRLAHIWRTPWV